MRCIWFDSRESLTFSGSFSTGQVVNSTAKIMFTFKLWLISYYKIFNFKHWTNVTPVGPQPRKKLQKTRVRHFSRQFFKTLSQSSQQSSCCHFIWIDENKLNIQFPQNSKVCVFKFWSLFCCMLWLTRLHSRDMSRVSFRHFTRWSLWREKNGNRCLKRKK